MNEMKRTANFGDNRPIYLQISGWICEKILRGEWVADQRIPSLRELGVLLEVNPNTVVRTCEYLLSQGVIYNRRGLGYFGQRGCRRTDPHRGAPRVLRTGPREPRPPDAVTGYYGRRSGAAPARDRGGRRRSGIGG